MVDATKSSWRRGGRDGHESRTDQHLSRPQEGWAGGGGGRQQGGEKHETPAFTRCSTAVTELPSPEPPQELSSPLRRRRSTEHPAARPTPISKLTAPPERTFKDIWRDPNPATSPQEKIAPNKSEARGRDGGDRRDGGRRGGAGGGADLDGREGVVEYERRCSVRDLAAVFGGGSPPRNASKGADTLRAGAKPSRPDGSSNACRGSDGSVVTAGYDTETTTSLEASSPISGHSPSSPPPSSQRIDQSALVKPPQNLGASARADRNVPPSSSPPDPPVQGTELRGGSSRLALLRARTNGAGVGTDNSRGRGGGSHVATDGGRRQRQGVGVESVGCERDHEAAGGNLSRTSGSAASIPSSHTLAQNPDRGGLLSSSGSLRLMAAAVGIKQQSSDAAGNDETNRTAALRQRQSHGGKKHDPGGRPTTTVPRAAQGASEDSGGGISSWYRVAIGESGDHGERGNRDDGGASCARRQRSQTSKPTPACISAAKNAAAAHTARLVEAEVGRVMSDIAPETVSSPQPHGRSINRPQPSPASASGYSTPPSAERPRRAFFGSPRQADGVSGLDGDGVDCGDGVGGGGGSKPNIATRPETAHVSLASRKTHITVPATNTSTNPSNKLSQPKTSVADAVAAAAASRDGRRAPSNSRRRPRSSSSDSPPSTPRETGVKTAATTGYRGDAAVEGGSGGSGGRARSKGLGASIGSRGSDGSTRVNRTARAAAAVVAAAVALNPRSSTLSGNGTETARPST